MKPANPLIERAALSRITRAMPQIRHSLRCVAARNPLAAEWEPGRLLERLKTKAMLSGEEATAVVSGIKARNSDPAPRVKARGAVGPEKIWGGTIDFLGAAFLERGYVGARSVARVAYADGSPLGTGFMVSDRLFVTNNHVISAAAEAGPLLIEFGYELDPADKLREATRFYLDAQTFFLTNSQDDLDYTLIAVGARHSGSRELAEFGWCTLSDASDKHALGEFANIVQHPDGRYKEVVLRENRLVSRLDTVLHYVADTEPGSSGSPVFNNEWRVIALHHWGGPWRQKVDDTGAPVPSEVNEGIRASAIVRDVRTRMSQMSAAQGALLQRVIQLGERAEGPVLPTTNGDANGQNEPRLDALGRVTWRVPVEISVRLPGLGATTTAPVNHNGSAPTPPALPTSSERAPDKDYGKRQGYKPKFIQGFDIALPALSKEQKKIAAHNLEAQPGDDPFELKYNHFSVVMNAKRKLAFFTACNIDGKTSKDIDRKTGVVTSYTPGSDGEALVPGAEASEKWWDDDRLADDDITRQDLYASQEVPGRKKGTKAWMDRMFQRGHLVRRVDPAWGTDAQALKAEADTFHFTNCTPQVGFFNMGSAPQSTPKSGGGQLWRAIEDYVRDNAAVDDLRVCVFTGPVLADKDPLWREHVIAGFRVPLRFWKLVVWSEAGKLRSLAMIADQRPVLKVMPERIGAGEAYADTSAVEDFVTTVKNLEQVTDLDFGADVRAADIRAGEAASRGAGGRRASMRRVANLEEIFAPKRRRALPVVELTPKRNGAYSRRAQASTTKARRTTRVKSRKARAS